MPKSSPECLHAQPLPGLVSSELDEKISLLELSGKDEFGDSEQAKIAKEIAAANVGTVILTMISP